MFGMKAFDVLTHVRLVAVLPQESLQVRSGKGKEHFVNKGHRCGGAFDVQEDGTNRCGIKGGAQGQTATVCREM